MFGFYVRNLVLENPIDHKLISIQTYSIEVFSTQKVYFSYFFGVNILAKVQGDLVILRGIHGRRVSNNITLSDYAH